MMNDRQRVERMFFPTMFLNVLESGVNEDKRDDEFHRCVRYLVAANEDTLKGLDDKRKDQLRRRVVRLHDNLTESARKAGARVDKTAMVTLYVLQAVLEDGFLVLDEGSPLSAAIIAIQTAIADAFGEPKLDASARKQARQMLSHLQDEGYFDGVEIGQMEQAA